MVVVVVLGRLLGQVKKSTDHLRKSACDLHDVVVRTNGHRARRPVPTPVAGEARGERGGARWHHTSIGHPLRAAVLRSLA